MKVLIVSDTHGRHAGIEEAIQREFPFQRLIHLGDAEGYEDYIADLAECPIDIVSGNNDFFSDLPDEKIVFIDDFGYGDLGCYGSTKHRTPHIDQMAKEGIRLTDFYVGSSVSTPSRSALLTGCYPRRVSMHVNADPTPLMSKGRQVLFPASHKGLNPGEITIAELMKEQGYATACIGKWHLGDQLPFLPTRQGFDYYYGIPYSNDMDRPYCPLPLMNGCI